MSDRLLVLAGEQGSMLFATFPASRKICNLLQSIKENKRDPTEAEPGLEGGIMLKIDAGEGVYLPESCIYKAWTLDGGFLATVGFVERG